jgi:hypothetical protein
VADTAAQAGSRRRLAAGSAWLSTLAVLGITVAAVMLVPRPSSLPQEAVDVVAVAAAARDRLAFTPAVPTGLPAGWTARQAGVRDGADGIATWHVGFRTPDGNFASIEQGARVTSRWVEILDSGAVPVGAEIADGTSWQRRYKDVRDVVTLLRRSEDRTTLVTSKGGGVANALTLARSIPVDAR